MREQGADINAESKYRDAISIYADTGLSIKEICEQTGVGFSAFSSYLTRHHRDLILKRHNLTNLTNVKLRGKRGQTTAAHYKYKDAITACDSLEYIEYNISQIARIFDVNCSSLANQLRRHYPEIVPRRESERKQRGITINLQYGARKWSKESYSKAVEILQTSDMTIEEVADMCNVSYTGLREHIIAYYPQITATRESKRNKAVGQKIKGERNGNWAIHAPEPESIEKYKKAIELYHTTSLDVKEIAHITSVDLGGLRYHLRTWHPELMVRRRGFEGVDLDSTKRYKKSTAEKYAKAIERLQNSDLSTAKVAAEFGLNPETFRAYVKEHYPELTATRGMTKIDNGKNVSKRSSEKYTEALHLYETTSESLKSIAARLGLTYSSVGGFIRRNHPEAIAKHDALLSSTADRFKDGISRLKNSDATINSVMVEFGYNEYFRIYIKANYPELLTRKTARKRYTGAQAAADKYAAAIECLRTTSETVKSVTAKFGLNESSFRKYLYKHAPDLLREITNRQKQKSDYSLTTSGEYRVTYAH